jgi:hypothetical protein
MERELLVTSFKVHMGTFLWEISFDSNFEKQSRIYIGKKR